MIKTPNDLTDIEKKRHSLAHLLAAAVIELYPDAKRAIGPAIENGFYYDFEFSSPISDTDLPKIEAKMRLLLPTWDTFERIELTKDKALTEYSHNPYKAELIEEFSPKDEPLSFYKSGEYLDLCRGGHTEHMKSIDAHSFKLSRVAGAYWRGDEKNAMLTRIYGLAFDTKDELDQYLLMMAEAEKRDHKVLGKQLKLFTFSPTVGSGLPLYLPLGNTLRETILGFVTDLKKARAYQFVWTPHLAKEELYKQSGHLGKYDAMLPAIEIEDGERLIIKPMNCPHHFQIYNAEAHSYRDLPVRIAENATDYRNEKSGELNGLFRVRSLSQDDTHHVVRHDQIAAEIDMILELTEHVYKTFQFTDFRARISTRDASGDTKYFGADKSWQSAEKALLEAVKRWGVPYFIGEGEAAFYGPKIDVLVKDALGREWQLTTIQLDYVQPENFDMTYVDEAGQKVRPAVLHVAILGSLDRFMAIAIEHFAGAFPLWLAPEQVVVLPIAERHLVYAEAVRASLAEAGLRVRLDNRSETLGKRIRDNELQKIPYILVVGDREALDKTVSVRHYHDGDRGAYPVADFINTLTTEVANKGS